LVVGMASPPRPPARETALDDHVGIGRVWTLPVVGGTAGGAPARHGGWQAPVWGWAGAGPRQL